MLTFPLFCQWTSAENQMPLELSQLTLMVVCSGNETDLAFNSAIHAWVFISFARLYTQCLNVVEINLGWCLNEAQVK